MKVTQLCLTLCDPMDYTVHEILQTGKLEWVAFLFLRVSSQPKDQTQVSCMQADSLRAEPQEKPKNTGVGNCSLLQRIFLTQESNWGLLHCRRILYQLRTFPNLTLHLHGESLSTRHPWAVTLPKQAGVLSTRKFLPTYLRQKVIVLLKWFNLERFESCWVY